MPPAAISAAWVPRSVTPSFVITMISSALRTVDSRCATTMQVRPAASRSRADWICISVALSSALVASSRMRIEGFFRNTRAIEMRCFCPPESLTPRSPTSVSYPLGSERIKSWMLAQRAASSTSASDASGRP